METDVKQSMLMRRQRIQRCVEKNNNFVREWKIGETRANVT